MIDKKFKGGRTYRGALATLRYLLNERVDEGTARLLHGNTNTTLGLIKKASNKFKWSWSSGVLSFEESLSDDVLREIAEKHRAITFCGLDPDQYNSLYIIHSDKSRSEIHYIAPRMELSTGKSLNLYYVKRDFKKKDLFQDLMNLEYGLSSPKLSQKRELVTQNKKKWATKKTTLKKDIDEAVLNLINAGDVQSRDDIIDFLRENDFELNRIGKEFISVLHDSVRKKDGTLDPIRLRGKIYGESFTDWRSLEEGIRQEDTTERRGIEEVRRELDEIVRLQTIYNRERYQAKPTVRDSKQDTIGSDLEGVGLEIGYSGSRGKSNASEEDQTKRQEPIREDKRELDEHRATAVIKRRREESRRSRAEFEERKSRALERVRELVSSDSPDVQQLVEQVGTVGEQLEEYAEVLAIEAETERFGEIFDREIDKVGSDFGDKIREGLRAFGEQIERIGTQVGEWLDNAIVREVKKRNAEARKGLKSILNDDGIDQGTSLAPK